MRTPGMSVGTGAALAGCTGFSFTSVLDSGALGDSFFGLARYASTSCFVILPPAPVPWIWSGSSWCSSSIFLTNGERKLALAAGFSAITGCSCSTTSAGASSACGTFAGFSVSSSKDSPGSPISPIVSPTCTVSPATTSMRSRVPDTGLGNSVTTLSVSSSTTDSNSSTWSPTCLSQVTTVSSSTPSPGFGAINFVAIDPPKEWQGSDWGRSPA